MSNYKITAVFVDTCLPDYWPGHYTCHICVPVNAKTTLGQLREALKDEVTQSAVMGSDMLAAILGGMEEHRLLHHFPEARKLSSIREADEAYSAMALEAIDAITAKTDLPFTYLKDLQGDEDEDEGDSVNAYFLLVMEEV